MSHQPERKERDCLNCGVEVLGSYCQNCGQKNTVVHQTFWQLFTHFVYDIFHFDGKFFDTLKYLLFKPGFVPKQYVQGKRQSYLDPIRMYLFTSALFFLVFFSLGNADTAFINFDSSEEPLSAKERMEAIDSIKKELAGNSGDTALLAWLNRLQDTSKQVRLSEFTNFSKGTGVSIGGQNYISVQQYDSIQNALPKEKRDGWFEQTILRKIVAVSAKYNNNWKEAGTHLAELFIHKLSYLLFVSLPFFALILKLLYVRRKTYYYSDHAVFTLYHYIFSFILLLVTLLLSALGERMHLKLFQNLMPFFAIVQAIYLYIAMRRYYGQGGLKTFSKFLLLALLGSIVLLLLFMVFLSFTFFQL